MIKLLDYLNTKYEKLLIKQGAVIELLQEAKEERDTFLSISFLEGSKAIIDLEIRTIEEDIRKIKEQLK